MKIKSKKELLLEVIQLVQITPPKTTMPILSNILLEAYENKLTLIATDLELSIKTQLELEILTEGSICLPLKKLTEIIRELEDKEDVLIEVEENNRVIISSKESVFHLFGLPKEDFPVFPEYEKEKSFKMASTLIKEMIKKTIFATAVDEVRYVLNGVFFVVHGSECKMVATDGHRLAFIKKTLPQVEQASSLLIESEVIIPTKALTEVNRIIKEDKEINIFLDKNKIVFQTDEVIIISRLIEGKFPDYDRVIPKDQDKSLKINNQKLSSTCRRIVLMTSEKTNIVKLDISKNKINFSSNTPNMGDAEEELEVYYEGEDMQIAFNPKYIIDILKNIEQEEITIFLKNASSSGMIKPGEEKEGEEYLCVLMPVRT
ncbi:DNA polymerase III subunit beta [Patescibacteria group bacterium]|nr:DNA polymerase III subunit beta [Patescibacteria group bacterium]